LLQPLHARAQHVLQWCSSTVRHRTPAAAGVELALLLQQLPQAAQVLLLLGQPLAWLEEQ
jgi:hypothetical protein